jgi:flavin-dependent dehydrogenase
MHPGTVHHSDVTVIGGGLAGMAASLHLAKAGFRVVCIEPETGVRQPVGESLDWASPALLGALGMPMEDLIQIGIATCKRGVTLQLSGGGAGVSTPAWLAHAPFHVELRTMHVDRMRLDRELQDLVVRQGVTVVHDKALTVERTGMRIVSIQTASGGRFASPWFIDASGSFTSLLAREFGLPAIEYGPKKGRCVGLFHSPAGARRHDHLCGCPAGAYLDWIWEIPIGPNTLSVGYVTTGEAMKKARDLGSYSRGYSQAATCALPASRVPVAGRRRQRSLRNVIQLPYLSGSQWPELDDCGRGRLHGRSHHFQWRNRGLRHAEEASALIAECRGRSELPSGARAHTTDEFCRWEVL